MTIGYRTHESQRASDLLHIQRCRSVRIVKLRVTIRSTETWLSLAVNRYSYRNLLQMAENCSVSVRIVSAHIESGWFPVGP
jgi:hypothetical protein